MNPFVLSLSLSQRRPSCEQRRRDKRETEKKNQQRENKETKTHWITKMFLTMQVEEVKEGKEKDGDKEVRK